MTASADWTTCARLLQALPMSVAVGIHLVLSADPGLVSAVDRAMSDASTIDTLSWKAVCGRLQIEAITHAVEHQFRAFFEALSRPPAFVDGHQHCHVLPGVRKIVLSATARHAPAAWIRNCADRPYAMMQRPFATKAFASAAWSFGMRRDAARYLLTTNDSFAGHYDFGDDFAELLPTFLRKPGSRHLVMCHPGSDDCQSDPIGPARAREAEILSSISVANFAQAAALDFG